MALQHYSASYQISPIQHHGLLLLAGVGGIDLIRISQNAPLPYPIMLHSEQKCSHFCSEWSIVGYGTGVLWDLWNWSIDYKTTLNRFFQFKLLIYFNVQLATNGSELLSVPSMLLMFKTKNTSVNHDDVIKWTIFPRYWPFVRGIHRSPVNSPHKGQWHGATMFCLNKRLRRHRAYYDASVK